MVELNEAFVKLDETFCELNEVFCKLNEAAAAGLSTVITALARRINEKLL